MAATASKEVGALIGLFQAVALDLKVFIFAFYRLILLYTNLELQFIA